MRTLLIDNYDSYTYNLFQVIAEVNGEVPIVYYNDTITIEQISSMVKAGTVHSIVISPGPGTPNNSTDIGVCVDVLQQLPDVPILGICLGHQALALAHGASVVNAPEPVHGRLSRLRHEGHALFKDIPSDGGFEVVRYHSLVVDEHSLPECLGAVCWTAGGHTAVKLARDAGTAGCCRASTTGPLSSTMEMCAAASAESVGNRLTEMPVMHHQQQDSGSGSGHGCLLMGLAHRSRPHFGVQFHPESVATRYGIALLRNFRDLAAECIKRRGGPAAAELPPSKLVEDIVGPPGRLAALAPWPAPEHQCGATLRLLWAKLGGALHRLPGGSQAVFELLYNWGQDTFWLDSAAADRGRFSYMGGRGGPLWRKYTYKLPLPTSAVPTQQQWRQSQNPGMKPSYCSTIKDSSQPPSQDLEDQPAVASGDHDSDSTSSSYNTGASSSSCGPESSTAGSCATSSITRITQTTQSHAATPHSAHTASHLVGVLDVEGCDGNLMRMPAPSGFLGFLQGLLEGQRLLVEPEMALQLPFNFCGGLVGYLGYELKAECGGANAHASTTPDAVMYLADRLVAVDHATGDVFLLALYDSASGGRTDEHGSGDAQSEGARRGPDAGADASSTSSRTEAQTWLQTTQQALESAMEQVDKADCREGTSSAATVSPPSSSPSLGLSCHPGLQCVGRTAPEGPCDAARSGNQPHNARNRGTQDAAGLHPRATDLGVTDHVGISRCTSQPSSQQQEQQQSRVQAGASTWNSVAKAPIMDYVRAVGQGEVELQAAAQGAAAACPLSTSPRCEAVPFTLAHSRTAYLQNIAACHAALHAGESYEVCLTTGLTRPAAPSPPQLYRTLRQLNPAPYAAWLQCGADGPTICCSSPERFLRGDRGGLLEARPIKGTAARVQADPVADAAAAAELASSEKERAENLMIVDLLRNDLGRVCEVGTVHVPGLMDIESYATVHQMVSTVRGVRRAGVSIIDCIRAAFPGGSMTGAPKVRTMQIIDALEDRPRGIYSGSIGFISLNDTFDLNIVIRTAVIEDLAPGSAPAVGTPCGNTGAAGTHLSEVQPVMPMRRMTIGAGGAIVVQSQPEAEYEEMRLKARALLRAVGLCEGVMGPVPVVLD